MENLVQHLVASLSVCLALWSALNSLVNLVRLYTNSVSGTGKDFDVYYWPVLLIHILWVGDFIYAGLSTLWGTSSQDVCSPSLSLFTHVLIGLCRLQIALNWMEVAGMHS